MAPRGPIEFSIRRPSLRLRLDDDNSAGRAKEEVDLREVVLRSLPLPLLPWTYPGACRLLGVEARREEPEADSSIYTSTCPSHAP